MIKTSRCSFLAMGATSVFVRLLAYAMLGIVMPAVGQPIPSARPSTKHQHFPLHGSITLDSVINYVHQHSGVRFSFNSKRIQGSRKIQFGTGAHTLLQVLQTIRKHTQLYYSYHAGYVIIRDHPIIDPTKRVSSSRRAKSATAPNVGAKRTLRSGGRLAAAAAKSKSHPTSQTLPANTLPVSNREVELPVNHNQVVVNETAIPIDSTKKENNLLNSSILDTLREQDFLIVTKKDTLRSRWRDMANKDTISMSVPSQTSTRGKRVQRWTWSGGLQWEMGLPLYGFKNYFTGTRAVSQPYEWLIPGAWLRWRLNDRPHQFLFGVQAFQPYFLGNKVLASNVEATSPTDSFLVQRQKTAIRSNTFKLSLRYQYQINELWFLGLGVQHHIQTDVLMRGQTKRVWTGELVSDSLYRWKSNDRLGERFASGFTSVVMELGFRYNRVEIGGHVAVPVGSVLTTNTGKRVSPIHGSVSIRWLLW